MFFKYILLWGILFLQNVASNVSSDSPSSSADSLSISNNNSSYFSVAEISQNFTSIFQKFAIDLYQNIAAYKREGNFIISPFSVQTNLALLYCGAGGQIAETMKTILKFDDQIVSNIINQFHLVLSSLEDSSSIRVANNFYAPNDLEFLPQFKNMAKNQFYAEVNNLNFSNSAMAVAKINNAILKKTNGDIKGIMPAKDIDMVTGLVMVNTLYFRQLWYEQFQWFDTHYGKFYFRNCTEIKRAPKVYMMMRVGSIPYGYIPELRSHAVELAFLNSNVKLTVILPDRCNGIYYMENALKTFDLNTIQWRLQKQPIILRMPKFSLSYHVSLNYFLDIMGMGGIFADDADFSGIFQSGGSVSQIMTKNFISLSEKGIYPVTTPTTPSIHHHGLPPFPWFDANHPFIFLVHSPQEIFYIGRVFDP